MSSFSFPAQSAAAHSTQFSFDESTVSPTFRSPSLSNHTSNKSVRSGSSTDDVVEATHEMRSGCFMIILKVDDKCQLIADEDTRKLDIEWSLTSLSQDFRFIEFNNRQLQIDISNIDTVRSLDSAAAAHIQRVLHINGVEPIGLQSVTLRLAMKDSSSNYVLIFDEYRNAFIWDQALRTMSHLACRKQPITTVALCCSAVDRINNAEMHDKMKTTNPAESLKWIHDIVRRLPAVQQHINRCYKFAEHSCILDSSEHLSLLLLAKSLKELYNDSNRLASMPLHQLSKSDVGLLREVWLSLLADLTVAMFKEHQLKNDMKASMNTVDSKLSMISK